MIDDNIKNEKSDLQIFIQNEMRKDGYDDKNQISLEAAAEKLEISTEGIDFHTAKDDSLVCAFLLKKCYNKERFEKLIKDASNPEFLKRLKFKAYAISKINDKNVVIKDKEGNDYEICRHEIYPY